jgi:hypothetical protein
MYTLRRQLAVLARALAEVPPDARMRVRARCQALLQTIGGDDLERP